VAQRGRLAAVGTPRFIACLRGRKYTPDGQATKPLRRKILSTMMAGPSPVRARRPATRTSVLMGGADVIRQALRAGLAEELTVSIAPVVLGGGKRLFDGFTESLTLEPIRVLQSPLATHLTYRVVR
jgi:dihydrofolate reductase